MSAEYGLHICSSIDCNFNTMKNGRLDACDEEMKGSGGEGIVTKVEYKVAFLEHRIAVKFRVDMCLCQNISEISLRIRIYN